MAELTRVPDAQRPVGAFIAEHVVPRLHELNSVRTLLKHNRLVTLMLRRRRIHVHPMGGVVSAFLFNGETVGGQRGRLNTLVSDQAWEACTSKTLMRQYFSAADLPIARGQTFAVEEVAAAKDFISTGGPWVIKPDAARHDHGISLQYASQDFASAWSEAVAALPEGSGDVLIDEFQDALNLRFYVVGSKVQAAVARIPLFVTGDGHSSIRELLAASFEQRRAHPLVRLTLPEISEELLKDSGRSLAEVPGDQELVLLGISVSLKRGGLPIDVTDTVAPELNDLAVAAAEAIPGFGAGGIDILAPELGESAGAVVLDADVWANNRLHRYPVLGRPRRAPAMAVAEQILLRAKHWDKPVLPPEIQDPDD